MTSKFQQVSTRSNKGAEILTITREKNAPIPKEVDLNDCVLFEQKTTNEKVTEIYIRHPYLSKKYTTLYQDNSEFFDYGRDIYDYADYSIGQITATLYEKDGRIIVYSGNGGPVFHRKNGCERARQNMPTGQGYELCKKGCHSINHSEYQAIERGKTYKRYDELKGANAYLYGHWWSCKGCSDAMEDAGINNLILSKEWTRDFLEI